jgi:hypothetical protein
MPGLVEFYIFARVLTLLSTTLMTFARLSLTIIITFLFCQTIASPSRSRLNENRRVVQATRVNIPPRLDGTMSDPVWHTADAASDFFMYEPHNDRAASQFSIVKVLYDDRAIYIGAKLFDAEPGGILTELGMRDNGQSLNADQFWVDINPFDDGINGFRFHVTASGVQTDINMSGSAGNRGDRNWDAVWKSMVSITSQGWVVEMQIPFSALRFPSTELQDWGINFWREVRRTRETSSWNHVNRRVGDPMASMGQLTGMNDVSPPLRLAFFPYLSAYYEKNDLGFGWANTINGGMDVKYGINQNFTLDMTLIPDFGQVQSDARVLNLSPFEVKYDENRQFFTEGTELYGKADLFYSRRIGSRPVGFNKIYQDLHPNEVIFQNPLETSMLNATKFSGRTSSGLGIGVFNGITAASQAMIKDTVSGETRLFTTQPPYQL